MNLAALRIATLTALVCFPDAEATSSDGPSLQSTLSFVSSQLSERGKLSFILFTDDARTNTNTQTTIVDEISAVTTDTQACELHYYAHRAADDERLVAENELVKFKDVKKLSVMTAEAAATQSNAQDGDPNWISTSTSPPTFVLVVKKEKESNFLYFQDQDDANRVAKAMLRAVELCGGGREPF